MYLKTYIPLMLISLFFINGCGGGGSSHTSILKNIPNLALSVDRNLTINNTVQIESLGKISISLDVNITNGPKDLYILLSNYASTSTSTPEITHNAKVTVAHLEKNLSANIITSRENNIIHAPQNVEDFRNHIPSMLNNKGLTDSRQAKISNVPKSRQIDIVGDTHTFQLDASAGTTTAATARKIISSITTNSGTKTLNIWVSNDSFGIGCPKTNCVTQTMVDILATQFLTPGLDNDIYDWVSNIYGAEWGADAQTLFTNLISYNGEITIVLTDINNDDSVIGGVVGYFFAKDNFLVSSQSGSNERIMFYIDSVLFATPDIAGAWDINDFWPQQMISTLAHEFQHMIHFYQKNVKFNVNSETWLNEMLSETTEDIVATKLQNSGPRNVVYTDGSAGPTNNTRGRYPRFNINNTLSLTTWNGQLADYSKVNAFGAFLIRNYGGAQLLHDIVVNNATNENAIVRALQNQGLSKTFNTLLTEWGEAVLLSDKTTLVSMPKYNTDAFTVDTYNGIAYDLGSINFFNYNPSVSINSTVGTVNPQGNYYYKVGNGLSGVVHIEVLLNGLTEATLIVK